MNLHTHVIVNFKPTIGTRRHPSLCPQVFIWEVQGVQEGRLYNPGENSTTQRKNKYYLRDEKIISFENWTHKKKLYVLLEKGRKQQSLKGNGNLLETK